MQASIHTIAYELPTKVLTNEELAEMFPEWTAEKILRKTGIAARHVLSENETVSELAVRAAEKVITGDIQREDIDFLILVTENADYLLPPTACIIQDMLRLPKTVGALDVNLGCSGFIYGLKLSKALIASGEAKNVLLITADAYSRRIHPLDKSTRTIFGDGAAATLITGDKARYRLGQFNVGTDGSGYKHLLIPAGGLRLPHSDVTTIPEEDDSGNIRSANSIYMNGTEIFNFSLNVVPKTIENTLHTAGLEKKDIDWFVFHQANRYMLDFLRKKLSIPKERFIIDMEDIGNTVSATIPIALKRSEDKGCFTVGDKILLCGFGVGLSWGSTIVEYGGSI